MDTFILVIHLLIAMALVLLVLVQRSEGSGLMGPSSAGMAPIRGSSNLLTRATAILAVLFFATSLSLAILANQRTGARSITDDIEVIAPATPLEKAPIDNSGNPVVPPQVPPLPAPPAQPAAPVSE